MPIPFRVLFFAGSLAAGTWVGLGKPSAAASRELVDHAKTEAAARLHPSGSGAPLAPEPPPAPPAPELAPLPTTEHADELPSIRPWPQLNPEASIERAWMVAEGPVYSATNGRRLVVLTFDDGPFPETTPTILRELAKFRMHAAFFVIGEYLDGESSRARRSREIVKKEVTAGHLVGNHTHDHQRLTRRTHTQVLEQIDRGIASIERATGKRPILFRPPFGELDEFGRDAVRERGLDLLLWSVDKADMRRDDAHAVFEDIVKQLEYKQGGIVLLHDIRWSTVAVLKELLPWLRDHRFNPKEPTQLGYDVVDLPTYLQAVAAAPLPYATRDDLQAARNAGRR